MEKLVCFQFPKVAQGSQLMTFELHNEHFNPYSAEFLKTY